MELIKKDNNNSIRVIRLNKYTYPTHGVIKRSTGLLNGTMTEQPDIPVDFGKAGRTIEEQIVLEYNSILSDYLDKGYRPVSTFGANSVALLTPTQIKGILADRVVDTNGMVKPMLARQGFLESDPRYKRRWYASYKIDGVRCTLRYDSVNKQILTSSRGGKTFEYSTAHITGNDTLHALFINNPNLILDGELYLHGKSLQFIQGLAKMKYYDANVHAKLQFHCFDIISDEIFDTRYETLRNTQDALKEFATIYGDFQVLDYIRFVEHIEVFNAKEIMALHAQAIADGYEGLILRDPHIAYGYGTRDWRMVKVKIFDDAEFTIIGATPGLRDEDMVFVLLTPNGQSFEAKPVGVRAARELYLAEIENYIGKKGCVKFFGYTPNGIPNLPSFKYVREVL